MSLATVVAFSVHPVPWCFDCEFPDPWGHIYSRIDDVLSLWSLAAPFIAGLFGFRKGWLVPIIVVFATMMAQPLGGVAWWSFTENEGPTIILLGVPACASSFGAGWLVRFAARRLAAKQWAASEIKL